MSLISFISWVNNEELYKGFLDSAKYFNAEFIKIGTEAKSMAEAYNLGTQKAKGDILVYVHQDVRIRDTNFQDKLEYLFNKDKQVGFVGVIGNVQKNDGSWWTVGPAFSRGWVLQGNNPLFFNAYDGIASQLDGLLMATDKRWKFPEELQEVHFIDLWMCALAEQSGLHNYIINSVVQHLSGGEVSSECYRKNWEIYKKKFFY